MGHTQLFLMGLVTAAAAAFWYDARIEMNRGAQPSSVSAQQSAPADDSSHEHRADGDRSNVASMR